MFFGGDAGGGVRTMSAKSWGILAVCLALFLPAAFHCVDKPDLEHFMYYGRLHNCKVETRTSH